MQPLSPKQIFALRRRERVSQGVLAHYLNVRPKLVSEWERGEKKPSGPSLKLLAIIKARGIDAIALTTAVLIQRLESLTCLSASPQAAPAARRISAMLPVK